MKKEPILPDLRHNDRITGEEEDVYGLFKKEMEVDSDVNEDQNREWLLDQSMNTFMKSMKK